MKKENKENKETQSKLKVYELNLISSLLSQCKNDKDLKSSSTTLSVIRLNRNIASILKEHYAEQDEMLSKLGADKVKKDGQELFDWSDKSDDVKEKIVDAIKQLNDAEYELNSMNSIDEEEFVILTRGLKQNELAFLYDYLVVKPE